jgi:hypothetical protein
VSSEEEIRLSRDEWLEALIACCAQQGGMSQREAEDYVAGRDWSSYFEEGVSPSDAFLEEMLYGEGC